jgi:RimJ/RimL family protein N-acetyltransferase
MQKDLDFVFDNWTQELTIAKYMTWKPHQTKEETNNFISFCIDDWKNNNYTWIIESQETKQIVGSFAARQDQHKLDIGYLILKDYWGNGYMTEVIKSFIKKAFEIESIHRVWAVCDIDNIASKRVMEKSGMSYEGVLKSWLVHPNMGYTPRDCHCLSIVK